MTLSPLEWQLRSQHSPPERGSSGKKYMGVWRRERGFDTITPRFPATGMRYTRVSVMRRRVSVSPKSLNSFPSALFSMHVILKLCSICQNKGSKMDNWLMLRKVFTAHPHLPHDASTPQRQYQRQAPSDPGAGSFWAPSCSLSGCALYLLVPDPPRHSKWPLSYLQNTDSLFSFGLKVCVSSVNYSFVTAISEPDNTRINWALTKCQVSKKNEYYLVWSFQLSN